MEKNVLNRLQEFQLFSELANMKTEIELEKMSVTMLNRAISPRLTFKVTDNNIRNACKVLKIELFRRPSLIKRQKFKEELELLKKEIEQLKAEVEELKKRKWIMQDGRAIYSK